MALPSRGTSRIGVDIGGTFTDLVWVDEATGAVRVGKVLTTPKDPAQAVEQGVVALLQDAGSAPASVRTLIHGTTLATNALIERKGARAAIAALMAERVEGIAISLLHAYRNLAHERTLAALVARIAPGLPVSC